MELINNLISIFSIQRLISIPLQKWNFQLPGKIPGTLSNLQPWGQCTTSCTLCWFSVGCVAPTEFILLSRLETRRFFHANSWSQRWTYLLTRFSVGTGNNNSLIPVYITYKMTIWVRLVHAVPSLAAGGALKELPPTLDSPFCQSFQSR